MKVFVTGATGFIGKNLVKRLMVEGFDVVCAGRNLRKLDPLLDRARAVYLNIEDRQAVAEAISREKPEAVFHCAALVQNHSHKKLWPANVEGTRNILDACLKENIKKIIYLSSVAVISGNPQVPLTEDLPFKATNRYGESKIEAEKIALEYREKGLRIAILRPPFVYGEDEPHGLGFLTRLIRYRLFPILGKGDNKLHLVCVDNVVDVMMFALSNEKAYDGSYFVADKEVLSVNEVFEYMAKVLRARPPLHIPQSFMPILTHLPIVGKNFSIFTKDRVYSIKRLEEELGYSPRVSVYDGLKKALLSVMGD